jgi:DNA helicase-2/ATP-dependent DNA helicase PcrA
VSQPNSHLTLAVAGSRKTQGLVEYCAAADTGERILILTYTKNNQVELTTRLSTQAGDHPHIEVSGWFAFLLNHFAGPFLPLLFPGRRAEGFDFDSEPQTYSGAVQWARYFNTESEARRVHLAQLATRINEASSAACVRRLERIYDRILIDEVQDLCGYDLEILDLLIGSSVTVQMVGDIRQAIMVTNPREAKNKKYMFMKVWDWFRNQEMSGRITITQRLQTWRYPPEIAALADSLFGPEWGFEPTVSLNDTRSGHDGVFLVAPENVEAYHSAFDPLLLRHSRSAAKQYDHLNCMNIGDAKGIERPHVLINPTEAIRKFITTDKPLEAQQAARFYVALTRAQHSAAIIVDPHGDSRFPYWRPENRISG